MTIAITESVRPATPSPGRSHTGRLLLMPADPEAVCERSRLVQVLEDGGFLGAPASGRPEIFDIGEQFLSLLIFAGCAVVLPGAAAGHPATAIRLPPPSPRPVWHHGRNTRAPRCPGCRTPLREWRERSGVWARAPEVAVACAGCGRASPAWDWDWKRQAGVGRQVVAVEEVFPGEAMPTDALFALLAAAGGGPWRHVYQQD